MSAKATATAAWDWKDPEAADQAPGPHPISAPIQVPPSPPHDPHMLPPKGFKKPWKGKVGKEKEIELPEEASEKGAEIPTECWWARPDKFMATFRFEFKFYTNCTLMATFYTHGYTHGYLLLSWPHSGLRFMRTATLDVTFKTHGYTHGYILRSWLHFTPGYTYGYILHSWLQSWLHLTLMPTPTYALGHGYILRSWLH